MVRLQSGTDPCRYGRSRLKAGLQWIANRNGLRENKMPQGAVWFPLVALIVTVVLLIVTRKKKPVDNDKK